MIQRGAAYITRSVMATMPGFEAQKFMDERGERRSDTLDENSNSSGYELNREYISQRKICVTGRLLSMTHAELAALVNSLGGTFLRFPTRSSFRLVVGDDGWPAEIDGSPSRILDRAQKLQAYGYKIEFVSEAEFLDQLGLTDSAGAIRGQHTMSDLARMLNVSPVRIRRWLRIGLIEPALTIHRLAYFNFQHVAFAKRLCELASGGASLNDIRAGIERVRAWLPEGESAFEQLAGMTADGRILLRLNDRLMDGHGQQYFDFEDPPEQSSAISLRRFSQFEEVSHLFDVAIELEDQGELAEAAQAYERAAQLEPNDPVLHFNLGNTLYGLGEISRSMDSFRTAIQLDPQYAEAWNNLGNVLAEGECWGDALSAFERAIQLVPNYADAHYNMSDLLKRVGRVADSERHWRIYEQHSAPRKLKAHSPMLLRLYRAEPPTDESS